MVGDGRQRHRPLQSVHRRRRANSRISASSPPSGIGGRCSTRRRVATAEIGSSTEEEARAIIHRNAASLVLVDGQVWIATVETHLRRRNSSPEDYQEGIRSAWIEIDEVGGGRREIGKHFRADHLVDALWRSRPTETGIRTILTFGDRVRNVVTVRDASVLRFGYDQYPALHAGLKQLVQIAGAKLAAFTSPTNPGMDTDARPDPGEGARRSDLRGGRPPRGGPAGRIRDRPRRVHPKGNRALAPVADRSERRRQHGAAPMILTVPYVYPMKARMPGSATIGTSTSGPASWSDAPLPRRARRRW